MPRPPDPNAPDSGEPEAASDPGAVRRVAPGALESTARLVERARSGDRTACDTLMARCMPALKRFAHGRVPAGARALMDTDDIVQTALSRAFARISDLELRGPGSYLAYMRQIVLNQVRDAARKVARAPAITEIAEDHPDPLPDPLEVLIGRQTLEVYERALSQLPPDYQEAVILRIEMGASYREIAESLGRPSVNAARMVTSRGLVRLVEHMRGLLAES